MNLKTLLTAALIACGTIVFAGCANEHTRSGGEVVTDASITTKVKAALLAEKDLNSFEIKAETFNGTVQLSGFVDSQWQIDRAGQVTAAVKGVKHVKNDLIHKPK